LQEGGLLRKNPKQSKVRETSELRAFEGLLIKNTDLHISKIIANFANEIIINRTLV
jgi:hypothetical protein